ncbi:MAG: hypothetical protein JW913_20930 [Chitinispirillaceae bacterium]|nr:hypothetical protein [Chitinispirillaceae bacterium]
MNIADEINRSVPIRRAFIWDRIIQLGFSPRTVTDQKSWIWLFKQNLLTFWGIENQPVYEKFSATEVNLTYPGKTFDEEMIFDCKVTDDGQFSINAMFGERIWWVHEYDCKFYSPSFHIFLSVISKHSRVNFILKNIERGDIEEVINGLILHPCVHQHIIHPVDRHSIRFGGGITNPFLYLFHLRYQLCPIEDRRTKEQERLANLFFNAIHEEWPIVNANELMKIPND